MLAMLTQHGKFTQGLTRRCALVLGVLAVRILWPTVAEVLLYYTKKVGMSAATTMFCSLFL